MPLHTQFPAGRITATVAGVALASLVAAVAVAGSTEGKSHSPLQQAQRLWQDMQQPGAYTSWPQWPGRDGLYKSASPVHGKYVRVFINETAAGQLEQLPPGSVIVKENFKENDPATLAAVTVMQRGEGSAGKKGNWFYVKYLPDGSVAKGPDGKPLAGEVESCMACHKMAKGGDYVYSNDK